MRSGIAAAGFHHHLALLDPVTGAETLPFGTTDVGQLVALSSFSSVPDLFAIRDNNGPDELVRLSTTTGAVTVLGQTGRSDIVAFEITSAGARAWSDGLGLVNIALSNGTLTDLFPTAGGAPGMRYMAADPATGTVWLGATTLQIVSLPSGAISGTLATFAGFDVRGAVFTTSRTQPIGQGCQTITSTSAVGAVQPFAAGLPFTAFSQQHQPSALGLQIVGFSETTFLGSPLPLSMDPIFGTTGCFLRVSGEITLGGVCDASGTMNVTINLPPTIGFQQFYLQHAVLEAVPGGISFSNGLRVRPGF
ncbi:MAG: hypothetical protein JNL08_21390 [Planctomycetes bacterium]|nr:hypothetical protein [Planctomycetota bacterium]